MRCGLPTTTLLHIQERILETTGKIDLHIAVSSTNHSVVLAPNINIHLLRSPQHRPYLPTILRRALRQDSGITIPLPGALRLPSPLRLRLPHRSFPSLHPPLPRPPTIFDTRLHLVSAKPRCAPLVARNICLSSTVLAVYFDGLQLCLSWRNSAR